MTKRVTRPADEAHNARLLMPVVATPDMQAAIEATNDWPTISMAAPASGVVTKAEFAALAEALERADNEFGYSMSLVRLVDGEATYHLKYNDGSEPLEFSCTEDVYAHVAKERASIRARAAIASLGLEVEG